MGGVRKVAGGVRRAGRGVRRAGGGPGGEAGRNKAGAVGAVGTGNVLLVGSKKYNSDSIRGPSQEGPEEKASF